MKILFVDLEYDYGIKARGPNIIGRDGFISPLKELGHEVESFFYDSYLKSLDKLQEDLLKYADRVQPDLIFFILFQDQFKKETLKVLKEKFTTINWFGDDTWRFDSFTRLYAPYFTYSITTDKFSLHKYKKAGIENVILSQWAAIGSHPILETQNYEYDISFIGQAQPYRKWFVKYLKKNGFNIHAFGHGWPNGSVSPEEMSKIFCKSKINLNIGNSSSFDLRFLKSSIKGSLQSIRNKKNQSQIKARNFEICYFNGFQLTDYVPSIEDYFEIGKEIVCYNTVDDLMILLDFYLKNNEPREKIRRQGHERAKSEHIYKERLNKVFAAIQR